VVILLAVLALLFSQPVEGQVSTSPFATLDTLPTRHEVDRERSHLYVVTHRAGLLSFLGHQHAIIPMEWSGSFCAGDTPRPSSRGSLRIQTSSLVIDSDSARMLASLGDGPSEGDVEEIQETLLDEDHLGADLHPEILVESVVAELQEDGRLRLRTDVTIRGVTRQVHHPVDIEVAESGEMRVSGSLALRQRQFGIEPESIFGVVRVADEVDLHFLLVSIPTDDPCETR
jgi:hypothetical protein